LKQFIEKYLKINNYEINYFTNWRNNITCLVSSHPSPLLKEREFNNNWIIIQKENIDFPENQKYLINKLILESEKTDLNLAWNYLENRFIEFEWGFYQVMKNIESTKISDEDFIKKASEKNIISTFEYLAKFHNFSEILEILENKKNIWKTFKSVEKLFLQAKELNENSLSTEGFSPLLFAKITKLKNYLNIIEIWNKNFQSWIIHWDPAFKNMLFDKNINAISLIDYEKVEYNNFMWDIADLARSLLKLEEFNNNLLNSCILKYCEIKNIPDIEKKEIINYLITLIFHVTLQYFLALFPESWVENKIWDNSDTIKKIERCFSELEKVKNWKIKI